MIADNSTRSFALRTATNCNVIPANVKAYSVNVAVFGSAPGPTDNFIIAFPTGSAQPNVATLNFVGGQTLSNAAMVPAGTGGAITIYTYRSTHIAIDVNGYFVEPVTTSVTAGAGLAAGSSGPGNVTLSIPALGVTSSMLAGNSVTTGAIQDSAVTAPKIATGQVVKTVNGLTDGVSISGGGATQVTTVGNVVSVNTPGGTVASGSVILGLPNDTNLIGAGYSEIGDSGQQMWRFTSTTGAPAARYSASVRPSPIWTGTKMIVWGGEAGTTYFNDGGQYDPATNSWTTVTSTGAPSARDVFSAVWTGSKMIVWGGFDGSTYFNTGGQYNPIANTWTATATFGSPSERSYHTAVWNGSLMIIWGWRDGVAYLNDGALYNPTTDAWAPTSVTGAPGGRSNHSAVWTGTKMIVWGGGNGTSTLNTGGLYDPAAPTASAWTSTSLTGAPEARLENSAVWTGTRLIIWGGRDGPSNFSNGAQYDPSTDSWTAIADFAFENRSVHSTVWTGTKMI